MVAHKEHTIRNLVDDETRINVPLGHPGVNNGASTSGDVIMMDESLGDGAGGSAASGSKADDEIGTDGVTSEGEKVPIEETQV